MKKSYSIVGVVLAMAPFAVVPAGAETLHYTINWQSGLSLGEAALSISRPGSTAATTAETKGPAPEGEPASAAPATPKVDAPSAAEAAAPNADAPKTAKTVAATTSEGGWSFQLTLDAAIPGFTIRDEYKSRADSKFCSEEFERTVQRGSTKSSEISKFDQEEKKVTRETRDGGGKSEMETSECAHDALAFLQFMREELAQGRLVPHQPVYFGAKYDLQVNYIGNDTFKFGDRRIEADVVRVNGRGPKADFIVEVLFSKDDNRTPLMARIPLTMGTFTVELTR